MRRHYWQFLVTDTGEPIENAEISIYQAGGDTPVLVYTDEVGTSYTSTAPQVTTSRKGYFEFWIADKSDPNGYDVSTKFKIAWNAPGVTTGYIDYVDVFAASFEEVVIGDYGTLKNKCVSNALASGWEDHKEESILDVHPVHGIDFVVYTDYSSQQLNKLVSNQLAYGWEVHTTTTYDSGTDSWASPFWDGSHPASKNPHGIDFIDVTSGDTEKNKLVSNLLGQQWTQAYDSLFTTPLFSRIEGRNLGINYVAYTGPVGYDAITGDTDYSALTSNDFITKGQHEFFDLTESITAGGGASGWTPSGGLYLHDIIHNKNIAFPPTITVWDADDNKITYPLDVINVSPMTVRIVMPDDTKNLQVRLVW